MSPRSITGPMLAWLLVIGVGGCRGEDEPAPTTAASAPVPVPVVPPADAAPPDVAAAWPDQGAPGPAYFAGAQGIVTLEDDTFTRVRGFDDDVVTQLLIGENGKVYALGFGRIFEIDRNRAAPITTRCPASTGALRSFALDREGAFWTVGTEGVARFHDGRWTVQDKASLGASVEFLRGIAVDRTNRVYVASLWGLHYVDATTWAPDRRWTEVELGEFGQGRPSFEVLASDRSSVPYALGSHGLLRIHGPGSLEPVDLGTGNSNGKHLAIASNGIVAVLGIPDALVVLAGAVRRTDRGIETAVSSMAVDGQGRVWLASDDGVVVIGADGQHENWPRGTFEALDVPVEHIVVAGAGPSLPTVGTAPGKRSKARDG